MSSNSRSVFPSFIRFNLYYHYVALAFIPLIFIPFFGFLLYPLLLFVFIGPALPLASLISILIYMSLGEQYSSVIAYVLFIISWYVPIFLIVLSYVKYRDALRGLASPKWLIILPITWAYPIPIMAYTIAIYHEYFLRVLRGERIFNSYRFPGVMEGTMLTLFVGFFIALIYTSVNIYMHYKLYKYYTETNRH